jgi:ABC-type transporter MlaC component
MNAYRLLRHPLSAARAAVLAGLSIGLCMQQAAALDEVVVSGAEVLAQVQAERAQLRADMDEFVRTLNRELREAFDASMSKPQPAPALQLSTIEVSTRG